MDAAKTPGAQPQAMPRVVMELILVFLCCRLQAARKVKPARKAQSRSKNPLKALRERENVKTEYSEVRSNVADKEVTRIKREQSE